MRTAILLLALAFSAAACAPPGAATIRGTPASERPDATGATVGDGELSLDIAELI